MRIILLIILSTFYTVFDLKGSDTTRLKDNFKFGKNSHFSRPHGLLNRLERTPDTLLWFCRFNETCCYFINDKNGKMHVDQWDYNKLTGFTFTPLNPQGNTAMIGWRHNPHTKLIELVPYWHINKKRIYKENPHLTVQPNEFFTVEMVIDKASKKVKISIKTAQNVLNETQTFNKIPKQLSLIHPYFGGTSRSPCAMSLLLKRQK